KFFFSSSFSQVLFKSSSHLVSGVAAGPHLSIVMAQANGKKSLIQILGERGKITREQAVEAMQRKQATTDSLEAILQEMGVAEIDLYDAQAASMGVPFLDVTKIQTTPEAKGLLPE